MTERRKTFVEESAELRAAWAEFTAALSAIAEPKFERVLQAIARALRRLGR